VNTLITLQIEIEKLRIGKAIENRKSAKLSHELMKLALAVSRKRTSVYYGTNHYCTLHNQFTDYEHIDECETIKVTDGKNTSITSALDEVDSFWELDNNKLYLLIKQLQSLQNKITVS
jgi:hypothetical protein